MKVAEINTEGSHWQNGTKGLFRMVEVRKGERERLEWIEGQHFPNTYYDWWYIFKYKTGGKFALHYDVYDNFIGIKKQ